MLPISCHLLPFPSVFPQGGFQYPAESLLASRHQQQEGLEGGGQRGSADAVCLTGRQGE